MLVSMDVDSVLLKTEERVLEEIYTLYKVKLNLNEVAYWNFYKDHYPLVLDFFNNNKFYKKVDKIDNMDIVLKDLIQLYGDNNIQLVTSSNEILKQQKEDCLLKHFGHIKNFDKIKIIHVGMYDEEEKDNIEHEKSYYTKNTILIDDAIHNIKSHIENNNKEALLIDYDYGWNKNFEHKLVKRVTNPLNINKIIENILKN